MEFENLDEQVKWEVRRVAVAFEVEEWEVWAEWPDLQQRNVRTYQGKSPTADVMWSLRTASCWLCCLSIGDRSEERFFHVLADEQDQRTCVGDQKFAQPMPRVLYRLGFEDEIILSQLPSLSAHEKLELRLSMPREFWPQKWLGEEGRSSQR